MEGIQICTNSTGIIWYLVLLQWRCKMVLTLGVDKLIKKHLLVLHMLWGCTHIHTHTLSLHSENKGNTGFETLQSKQETDIRHKKGTKIYCNIETKWYHAYIVVITNIWHWPWTVCVRVLSRFSQIQLFVTQQTVARQTPLSMGFSGTNTGVGCHALLQGIFLTQE